MRSTNEVSAEIPDLDAVKLAEMPVTRLAAVAVDSMIRRALPDATVNSAQVPRGPSFSSAI
jgi:hypothetical protein